MHVEYCHMQSVYHCDLKPENILVGAGGILKLADFGLASTSPISVDFGRGSALLWALKILPRTTVMLKCLLYKHPQSQHVWKLRETQLLESVLGQLAVAMRKTMMQLKTLIKTTSNNTRKKTRFPRVMAIPELPATSGRWESFCSTCSLDEARGLVPLLKMRRTMHIPVIFASFRSCFLWLMSFACSWPMFCILIRIVVLPSRSFAKIYQIQHSYWPNSSVLFVWCSIPRKGARTTENSWPTCYLTSFIKFVIFKPQWFWRKHKQAKLGISTEGMLSHIARYQL